MSKVKTMNKYCLKGEYYEALEVINIRLKYSVSTSFRKEVLLDLIDLFYRNQELGNTLSETIGGSLDNFISEILDSYYSTLGTKKFLNYLFQNGLLVSIISALFYIGESKIGNNAEPIAFATILCAIGGFIMGVSSDYVAYKLLYKKSSTFVNLVQTLFSLIPIEIIILFNDFS